MDKPNLILIEEFCAHHDIDLTFIDNLNDYGLIEVVVIEYNKYFSLEQLNILERFIRLHYEMGINIEGIDAISHLLNKVNLLQEELNRTKNKLKFFELD